MKTKFHILTLMLALASGTLCAQTLPTNEQISSGKLKKDNDIPTRPRTPQTDIIICYYNNGIIRLSFLEWMTYANLTIRNEETGELEQGSLQGCNETLYIPLEAGLYSICCETNNNATFMGTIEIP